jgi:CMP-N-acetylneuraminic acid synthetase/spore coat polysaccharide biosynthesis predicted glycosyltransferase SpsG
MSIMAIIPVRGGSRGIPRKNARILGGKPLLAHSVQAALASGVLDGVYVTTDDAELAEIARRYGADVLDRPAALAADHVGLDAVIVDAVRAVEERSGHIDHVVSIQATCPLLKPETIAAAVRKCVEEDLDTVLTVTNDTHLCWGLDASGQPVPLYKARVNRQYLPPVFRETGGIFVCRRSVLKTGTRFGERVGMIELGKGEALDVDDRFDWWLVEKSLARRRICFRVIGNRKDGLGHVNRALTLADRLIDHDLSFVVDERSDLAKTMIETRFYPCRVAAKGDEVSAIHDCRPDLLINDILDTKSSYMSQLRAVMPGLRIINFEDLGQGARLADYAINEMYAAPMARHSEKVLSGTIACCLRDEFYSAKPITINDKVENVLLMFGGTDPNDLTMRCMRWLDQMSGDWEITAILGLGYSRRKQVEAYARTSRHPVRIVVNTKIVSCYMEKADLAVSSAGRTVFELASLGVPTIVIAQNKRECSHVFAKESLGVINIGSAKNTKMLEFQVNISQLLGSRVLRFKMHQALLATDVRHGIDSVLKVIQDTVAAIPRQSKSKDRRIT